MTSPQGSTERGTDLALVGVSVAVSLMGLLWVAAWLAAAVTGQTSPTQADPVALLRAPDNPGMAFGTELVPWVYWLVVAVLIGGGCAVAWWVWSRASTRSHRNRADPHRLTGLATASEVRALLGARAVMRLARTLRPSLGRPRPADVAYLLGRSRGVQCWVPVEHSVVLLGPARQGKGVGVVLPMICEAPGAVVSTSVRTENARITWPVRAERGPVVLFDPAGVAVGESSLPQGVRWSLDRGCQDPAVAMARARALAANSGRGVENGDFWAAKAVQAIAPLLHAAALTGGGVEALYEWAHSPARARGARDVLDTEPDATVGWAGLLEGVISAGDPRTMANMWAQVEQALLVPLSLPTVRESLSPSPGAELDVERFLREHGTLYIVSGETGVAAGVIAALVEDVYDAAYRLANTSPGNRLDPPLLLALDELANIARLPSLGAMVSAGGGAGITTLAVLQSLSQARDRWGQEAAAAIWGSATTKVVLGGLAEDRDLAAISALLGERSLVRRQVSESNAGTSRSWSEQDQRVMTPGQVRAMPKGTGLLISGSAPVALVDLVPTWKRPYRDRLGSDR